MYAASSASGGPSAGGGQQRRPNSGGKSQRIRLCRTYLFRTTGEAGLKRIILISALTAALAACTPAQPLTIENADFRPPLGSTGIGAAYFTIRSAKDDAIIAISSSAADSVEIHTSVTKDGRSSMQRIETLELPAGKTVRFEPGGNHLMVFSPRVDAAATAFPITIELQSGGRETVSFKIAPGGGNHPG